MLSHVLRPLPFLNACRPWTAAMRACAQKRKRGTRDQSPRGLFVGTFGIARPARAARVPPCSNFE